MTSDPMAGLDIPNLDDSRVNRLTAVRAACQVIGPPNEAQAAKELAWEFERWLNESPDHADVVLRRYVLMTVTHGRASAGTTERAPMQLRKIADELYRYIL